MLREATHFLVSQLEAPDVRAHDRMWCCTRATRRTARSSSSTSCASPATPRPPSAPSSTSCWCCSFACGVGLRPGQELVVAAFVCPELISVSTPMECPTFTQKSYTTGKVLVRIPCHQ